jgi:hypothetical protein
VTGYATGSGGSKVKGVLYFPTDPGYRDTVSTMCLILAATADCMFMETQARMLVESGLSLAFGVGSGEIKTGGGVFTPASCQVKSKCCASECKYTDLWS